MEAFTSRAGNRQNGALWTPAASRVWANVSRVFGATVVLIHGITREGATAEVVVVAAGPRARVLVVVGAIARRVPVPEHAAPTSATTTTEADQVRNLTREE